MYKVEYGCTDEWWDINEYETMEQAEKFIQSVEDGEVTLDLYSADYAFLVKEE